MTSPQPSPMDTLNGLLEERNRYEGWLGQLDAHRQSIPLHVVDRVRTDYEARLRSVIEQLRERATELEASAASLDERQRVLTAEETTQRDERAEAELRAAVGEYSAEYSNGVLARCDEAITRLTTERDGVVAELNRIREILVLVKRPVEAPPAPAPEPAAPQRPAENTGGAFDELAFLQSVVQSKPAPAAPPPGVEAPAIAASRRTAPQPETVSREMMAQTRSGLTPHGVPAFLKDVPTEQSKTLRCQECGTMNYATEWYCERCGGELAAM